MALAHALFLTISLTVSLTLLSTTLPYLYSLGDSHYKVAVCQVLEKNRPVFFS